MVPQMMHAKRPSPLPGALIAQLELNEMGRSPKPRDGVKSWDGVHCHE